MHRFVLGWRLEHDLSITAHLSVQVWRPLRGPVNDSPLGMIDAASVAKEDLLPYTLYFPGRTGYNYAAKYNPEHRSASCMRSYLAATC